MRCKHCGREVEPIVPGDEQWRHWINDYAKGRRYRHVEAPTLICEPDNYKYMAEFDEAEVVAKILQQYDV